MNQRYQLMEPRGSRNNSETIGEGAYGVVYKALDRSTSKFVALKKIRVETEFDGISPSTLREITLLMQMNHENVVKLENVVMDKERMSLIFELMDSDLKKYLDQTNAPLPLETIRSFTLQLLSGLSYCHSMGVMHRDLKPHNILISSSGKLKIADFGLARSFTPFNRSLTTEVITRWYRAPEILLGYSKYCSSVDLWSIGCILAEMSNNQALLMGDSDIDQLYKIFKMNGTPTSSDWPEIENLPYYRSNFPKWYPMKLSLLVPNLPVDGVDLLQKLFDYDPFRRITAKAALQHIFLSDNVSSKSKMVSPGSLVSPSHESISDEIITDTLNLRHQVTPDVNLQETGLREAVEIEEVNRDLNPHIFNEISEKSITDESQLPGHLTRSRKRKEIAVMAKPEAEGEIKKQRVNTRSSSQK
mmetsp:Transcript_19559/g.21225  ORF Transcript_19559/g.21225 Transcript_19559/m.21225 type:complete len:416 (+) Transcript_19559:25-1272(+)|eukprot:CAMPEP_0173141592 /NCGR_PEP_ID=MMETSP1105-20130129/5592_1 /TAXON_ID=2985 /ORGANISM="Ochromonas sp., Strain BG-1" /LENGTH=415 /DNA_ID=CAMNT_0014054837 /DNA_START=7 /DNA_END=1254 /DNA_ORIENTATION=-